MKRKELRKLLAHFLKLNQSLVAAGQKQLTALQAKLHYLSIISQLPSYGAKCFNTSIGVRYKCLLQRCRSLAVEMTGHLLSCILIYSFSNLFVQR